MVSLLLQIIDFMRHWLTWRPGLSFFCQSQYNCPELSAFKLFGSTQSGVCPLKYWILKKPVNLVKYHNRYLSICASLIAKYVYNIPKQFVSRIFCEHIKVKYLGWIPMVRNEACELGSRIEISRSKAFQLLDLVADQWGRPLSKWGKIVAFVRLCKAPRQMQGAPKTPAVPIKWEPQSA